MRKALLIGLLFLTGMVAMACGTAEGAMVDSTPEPAAVAATATTEMPCELEPIVAPTMPAEIPGYVELDPATGLHMTGTPIEVDLLTWQLEVTGTVSNPLTLTYDELRCMPKIELRCTLVCPGFFQDDATWAGVPLDHILELAGAPAQIKGVKLYSADHYGTYISQQQLMTGNNFLAYEWEGEPVPVLHGFPVRMVFPALDGNKWVKWLVKIEVYA